MCVCVCFVGMGLRVWLLVLLLGQVCVCQHWSYGWMPGGKRNIGGQLEATFRMMDGGNTLLEEPKLLTLERLKPYGIVSDESGERTMRRNSGIVRRELE
uniref:Progonadoliberin n=1 Tax=Denticeps clupeoides TaxID=299321 RepID=A0AAY4DK25_9TELE